jgi:hypothetical protein
MLKVVTSLYWDLQTEPGNNLVNRQEMVAGGSKRDGSGGSKSSELSDSDSSDI